jgi:hypothetical protein
LPNSSNSIPGIPDTNIQLNDLSINTLYSVTVTTIYANQHTYVYRKPNLFRTLNERAVTDVSYNNLLNTSVTISFLKSPGENNKTYTLTYYEEQNPDISNSITRITDTDISLVDVSLNGLKIYTTYSVTVTTIYNNYHIYTYPEPIKFQTLNEGPTQDISVNNILNTSATIYFASPGDVQSYTIKYGKYQEQNSNIITEITQTNFSLTGLSINTRYSVTVTTIYKNNHAYAFTRDNLFITLNEGPTTDISYSLITNTSATVSFAGSPGASENKRYTVTYTDPNQNSNTSNVITNNSLVLNDLSSNTLYSVMVTTYYNNNPDVSYNSNIYSQFQTLNEGPTTDISYNTLTNTSAIVSFVASPGDIKSYAVTYTDQNNNSITKTDISNAYLALTDLSINTLYSVTVTTFYNSSDASYNYSKSNLFTTLNEGPTSLINVTNQANDILITFFNRYGSPDKYTFHAKSLDSSDEQSGEFLAAANENTPETLTIAGLRYDLSYNVYVITTYPTSNYTYRTDWPLIIDLSNAATDGGNTGDTGFDGYTGDTGPA